MRWGKAYGPTFHWLLSQDIYRALHLWNWSLRANAGDVQWVSGEYIKELCEAGGDGPGGMCQGLYVWIFDHFLTYPSIHTYIQYIVTWEFQGHIAALTPDWNLENWLTWTHKEKGSWREAKRKLVNASHFQTPCLILKYFYRAVLSPNLMRFRQMWQRC
jgi:hypothetical protein